MIGSSIKYLDINKSAREIKNSGSKTPSAHFEKLEEEFPILIPLRFPITNISALLEPDYDNTINTLVDKNIITPVIAQIDLPLATNRCVAANKYTINVETITGSGLSYMVMANAAQVFVTCNIVDNIAKHFPLIVFPSYMTQCADLDKNSSSKENKAKPLLTNAATPVDQLMATKIFVQFMVEHKNPKTVVEHKNLKAVVEKSIK